MRNTFWYAVIVVGMIISLFLGGGLVSLALITAIGQILSHLSLVSLAYQACPGLRLSRSDVHWSTIKSLYVYSGKTLLPTLSDLLLNQTISVLVVGSLGPAALALFSRPRSLLRQMDSLERKMAQILVPTTSSLQAHGNLVEIERLVVKSVRYSIYLVLPLVMVLVVFGGDILSFWMGPNYANWSLPAVLAIGFLGTCIQTPIFSMLSGLNAHGRAGLGQFVASVISAASVFVVLKFAHGSLTSVAVVVTVPFLIVNLFYLPMVLCRQLNHSLGQFYQQVGIKPLSHVFPFSVGLVAARILFQWNVGLALVVLLLGSASLAMTYWKNVLPNRLKSSVNSYWQKAKQFVAARNALSLD
jgi:O-antigen/teichoic acid export membrane protein